MKLWKAIKAMEDGSEWESIWVAPNDEWEFYDSRKDVHPFFIKLYKAIYDLGPDYQKMLDELCNGDNCNDWELARLCTMFDDIYKMLERYNEEYKLNKEDLIRKL
jgi:hypothetical protein